MIPITLKLSNFTSYGASVPVLDFRSFHMAAISGLNGSGKSSIIDAITWVLWGESRTGSNSDKLIRLGQTTMSVELEFELEGVVYQVHRKRSSKGSGLTSLELFSHGRNLTEGTIKATQQKITHTLRMDYEVFVNSSYLRQGRADEFTLKPPTERKEILSNILGLNSFDLVEERAKQKSRECTNKISLLEFQMVEISKEIEQKDDREKSLTQAQEQERFIAKQLEQLDVSLKEIQLKEHTLSSNLATLKEKQEQAQRLSLELSNIKVQMDVKETAKAQYQQILNQKEEIETNYKRLSELGEQQKLFESKRSILISLKDQLASLQKVVIEMEQRRSRRITSIEVDINSLKTKNSSLSEQNKHLMAHKDTCPTCGQNIEEAKNRSIMAANQAEIDANNTALTSLQSELEKCKNFVIMDATKASQKEQEVHTLEEQLKPWSTLAIQVSELQKYNDLYTKLQQAQTALSSHHEALQDLAKMYRSKTDQYHQYQKALIELVSLETALTQIHNELALKESVRIQLNQSYLEKRTAVGEAAQLVTRATQMQEVMNQKQAEKQLCDEQKNSYDELALAFGKKGIQTMLIESIIPELEDEANLLLDKLTDGRMNVHLSTQRESKTGGTIETLDIIISDESGSRSYETYSGGEAFRVNIALRLALSKLLTQRAGARLQFLIIDEGFGTQDTAGRDRVIEAINLIQESFAKIIVITHIEELKELFPARIEVLKGAQGSTFQVIS